MGHKLGKTVKIKLLARCMVGSTYRSLAYQKQRLNKRFYLEKLQMELKNYI